MFAVVLRFRAVRPLELVAFRAAELADDGSGEADETDAIERVGSLEAIEAREDISAFC